jgi:hypothetical protein
MVLSNWLAIAPLVDFSQVPTVYLLLSSGGVAFIPLLLGSLFLTLRRVLQQVRSPKTVSVPKPTNSHESVPISLTDEHLLDQSLLIARLDRLEKEVEDLRREVEQLKLRRDEKYLEESDMEGRSHAREAILDYRYHLAQSRLYWLLRA